MTPRGAARRRGFHTMFDMTLGELLRFDWLQLRVGSVIAVALIGGISLYAILVLWRGSNRLSALDNRCTTATADIDAQLKYRHNLIPGLVETVRGYVEHENEVLIAVTEANAEALRASSQQAQMEAEVQLGNSITSLLQAAQKYPDLKASDHFRDLKQQLIDVENRVTAARRFFNLATEEYNNQLGRFPLNLVAKLQRRQTRSPYSLGKQRAAIDAPLAFKF
jgi:LemA protein